MTDITQNFGTLYYPSSALVFYRSTGHIINTYVEHFDFDPNGKPKNAHPLTENEGRQLAKALMVKKENEKGFLTCGGLLPSNVLRINPDRNGSLLWFSKERRRNLFFSEFLEIPNGTANVPSMLWLATKKQLTVFALAGNRRPSLHTPLYYAPFFNVYADGNVCMGNVNIDIKNSASIEEFMQAWEEYFFNSYFSHLFDGHNPVVGNAVLLWRELINTELKFPKERLVKTNLTLKNLL